MIVKDVCFVWRAPQISPNNQFLVTDEGAYVSGKLDADSRIDGAESMYAGKRGRG